MSNDIERYIEELRSALAGSDLAMIQDAVGDAEEHLIVALQEAHMANPGMSSSDAWRAVVDEYGAPGDVAKAYLEMEERTRPILRPVKPAPGRPGLERFFAILGDPRAYAALVFNLFSLVTGILYFTWAVTGLSLSVGLIVLIIGLPFFGLFVFSIQGLALVEGMLIEAMLGIRMPRRPVSAPRVEGLWRRFMARITDRRTWSTLLYLLLKLPMGVISFSVFITLLAYAVQLILLPVIQIGLDMPLLSFGDQRVFVPLWSMPILMLAGFLELVIVLHLSKYVARASGAMAKAMLVRG